MGVECSSDRGSCETQASGGGCEAPGGNRCPCGTACGGDPIECGMGMWTGAFFQAMKDAQVDLLKAKIQKAWGAKMDKAADAILEAMGTQWQTMLAQAQAKADVRERLRRIWQEGQK